MDYKKDIKDTVSVGNGVPFHTMVNSGNMIVKKCERLATAMYLVTNFLSDTEPMKPRLRELTLDFVREASHFRKGNQVMESNVLESLRHRIEEILSLLELSLVAGLVSEMNFTILKREYASLRDMIQVKKNSRESQSDSILGDNFFGTDSQGRAFVSPPPRSDLYAPKTAPAIPHKGHSIGQTSIAMSDRKVKESDDVQRSDLKNLSPRSVLGKGATATPRATTDIAKESRRMRILKLVKDNREVTIKDISTHFPDLSEKTIQRELVLLVDTSVLKKFGERRWSRYTLA